jgi:hypothetical protein
LDKEFYEEAFKAEYEEVKVEPDVKDTSDNPQPVDKTVDNADENGGQVEETTKETPEETKFSIDGEEYTLDQIKQWKLGDMRQADYTKKTQEIAKQRKEHEQAIALFEYVKNNPDVATALRDADFSNGVEDKLKDLTPEAQKIQELEYQLAEKELDEKINSLKTKYPDFNEVEVMQECDNRKIYDLEFVYNAMRGSKEPTQIDVETIKKQAIDEAKKQIMAEMKANSDSTSTIISTEGNADVKPEPGDSLTAEEKKYCDKIEMDYNEYAKWKTK